MAEQDSRNVSNEAGTHRRMRRGTQVMARIGFLINPIAGMGGRVGLKGTDGVVTEAVRRGAVAIADVRAIEMLGTLKRLVDQEPRRPDIQWLTCAGAMGAEALRQAGIDRFDIVCEPATTPSARDTERAVSAFVAAQVDLVVFCGGDGTARDVCGVTQQGTAVLGIPSGVKMYSGVFGMSAVRTAEILLAFIRQQIGVAQVEILDLDEDAYRHGEWIVRLHLTALAPFEPSRLQAGKAMTNDADDAAVKHDIGDELRDQIDADPDAVFVLGPGSTVRAIAQALGIDTTLLGVDAIVGGKLAGKDLGEGPLLDLLQRYGRRKLVLSPIGAQGFVLGRGNQQLSPTVVRTIGPGNLVIVATPAKLARTPLLRFDTGDPALDCELISRKYMPVIVGYRRMRMVKTDG